MEWFDLTGFESYQTGLSYTNSNLVIAGKEYQVRVRAHNVHGWGPFSQITKIKSTSVPEQPQPPTTLIRNQSVKIAWVAPFDSYAALTEYTVLIAHSDLVTYSDVLTYCDGANPVTFALQACEIPLEVLMSSPFWLAPGDQVLAKVKAANSVGFSQLSEPTSSGALI